MKNIYDMYEALANKEELLSVIGLGYVGMPIAVEFAKRGIDVIGFDLNAAKIKTYLSGVDPTQEVGDEVIRNTTVQFTFEEQMLRKARFHIVAVPTPVKEDHTPDLAPIEGASRILGRNLTKGSIVVFESTVFPGVTEEICVPIMENGQTNRRYDANSHDRYGRRSHLPAAPQSYLLGPDSWLACYRKYAVLAGQGH